MNEWLQQLEFDNLRWLNLLWAVFAVGALGVYGLWRRAVGLRRFADRHLLDRLTPRVSWTGRAMRLLLLLLALVSLVIALMHPRWGDAEVQVTRRGIDVMVLLDVSRSMLARDQSPNRLERAKLSLRDDLLPQLAGDRIGLITFAGRATLACPLTGDYGFFRLVLDDVDTDSAGRGGTLIGDAIRTAADSFDDLDTHKIVLLITDGEDHDSFPIEAARALWEDHHIPVVAVALGDERDGARIPVRTPRGEEYLRYEDEVVWTKANFDDLRRIAAVSDLNAFVPVGTRNYDLGEIYRRGVVKAIDYDERAESERIERPSRYHMFAVGALVLVLIDSVLRNGPRRGGTVVALPEQARKRGAA